MDKDDNIIVLDLGDDYSAAQNIEYIYTGSGTDTITIDPSWTTSVTGGGYTIGTSASLNWQDNYDTSVNITGNGITMKEGSDIVVGGKSLVKSIEKIEERLAILKPNPALEDRWEQLKVLRQQYIDLEKELLEKEKMWDILKKS